jgi:hypothetical protein
MKYWPRRRLLLYKCLRESFLKTRLSATVSAADQRDHFRAALSAALPMCDGFEGRQIALRAEKICIDEEGLLARRKAEAEHWVR